MQHMQTVCMISRRSVQIHTYRYESRKRLKQVANGRFLLYMSHCIYTGDVIVSSDIYRLNCLCIRFEPVSNRQRVGNTRLEIYLFPIHLYMYNNLTSKLINAQKLGAFTRQRVGSS